MSPLCRTLAVALVALALPASAFAARAADPGKTARAQERYLSSYGTTDTTAAALAQERYLGSYGDATPLPRPVAPVTIQAPSDGPSWLLAGIAGALLMLMAAGVGVIAGRRLALSPRKA
jgi:hypothetical protein